MLAALDGDAAAYRTLLAELRTALARYFARRLGSALAASADDLVQDTLMAIHTKRLTFDRTQRMSAWVFAIARYRLIDLYRRSKIRATIPLEADDLLFAPEEEPATSARLDIDTMLHTVPARQAELIRRVRVDGATIAEAAADVGMTETAAKVSIHRGLKALTARFSKEGGDER
jgi:RNA polymerase sigma-70 factor (ECF subfamily)